MANEGRDDGRPGDPADLLKDARLANAVIRLVVAASGAGCLTFAGYHAASSASPEALIVAGFLVAGLILLVLALAAEPTTPSA